MKPNNPSPFLPVRKELTEDDLLRHFSLGEAFKMVYLPIILTKSAFDYADFARRICAEKRLSFNKPCREIRQAVEDWNRRYAYTVRMESQDKLQAKVESFFEEADNSLQVLWYTIKNQLAKQFPQVGNYDLLANIYMAVILLDYVRKVETVAGQEIRRRTGAPYVAMVSPECVRIRRALMGIAGAYKMDNTDTLRAAIRALALKADKMVQVVVTHNYTSSDAQRMTY